MRMRHLDCPGGRGGHRPPEAGHAPAAHTGAREAGARQRRAPARQQPVRPRRRGGRQQGDLRARVRGLRQLARRTGRRSRPGSDRHLPVSRSRGVPRSAAALQADVERRREK